MAKTKLTIAKTPKYKVGVCSITQWVGKKDKLAFDAGKTINVSQENFDLIVTKYGWGYSVNQEGTTDE